jgi:tetratricopeptide (TPR) repeat protein
MPSRTQIFSVDIDKALINQIMRIAVLRLHAQQIYVVDILVALAQRQRFSLTRGKFDDWFMTRPDRAVAAPIALFINVIEVLFQLNPAVLSPAELKQLMDARGIPIYYFPYFARFLPIHDREHLYTLYELRPLQQPSLLIGRDALLAQIQDNLASHHCIVLTGPKGVGKSAIAYEIAKKYAPLIHAKIQVLDCAHITSFRDLIRLMLTHANVSFDDTHEIHRRLKFLYSSLAVIIVLDNFNSKSFTVNAAYQYFKQFIPQCKIIVTMFVYDQVFSDEIIEYSLSGLAYDTPDSAAIQLFRHTLMESYGRMISFREIQFFCEKANGNPLEIITSARSLARAEYTIEAYAESLLLRLSEIECVILLMLTFTNNMSILLVAELASRMLQLPKSQIMHVIDDLVRQRLVTQSINEISISIYDDLRQPVQNFLSVDRYKKIVYSMVDTMCDDTELPVLLYVPDDSWVATLRFDDYHTFIQFIKSCVHHRFDELAIRMLICWHQLFIVNGLAHQAVLLFESLTPTFATTKYMIWIQYALAMLYSERGMYQQAQIHCAQLQALANTHTQAFPVPLLAHVNALIGINTANSKDQLALMRININDDMSHPNHLLSAYYMARAYAINAQLLFSSGDYQQALSEFNQALEQLTVLDSSLLRIQVLNDRAVVMLFLGFHSFVQEQLTTIIAQFQQQDLPLRAMQAQLRLALSYLFVRDIDAVMALFPQVINTVVAIGNIKDMLYFLDMHIGLLMLLEQYADVLILDALMTTIREQRGIPRGGIFDQFLNEDRHFAQQYFAKLGIPAIPSFFNTSMQLFDIFAVCRRLYTISTPANGHNL